ncbi:MAG: YibE/F family protein [Actinobacteria bacterium]|nr:YibE/F family protein [Actinomycetota bacterium]
MDAVSRRRAGHAHSHAHDGPDPVSRRTRRALVTVVVVIGVLTAVGMVALWPGGIDTRAADRLGLVTDVYAAEVERVASTPCRGTTDADGVTCIRVHTRLLAGPDEGARRTIEFSESVSTPDLDPGDEIVLSYQADADARFQYSYSDRQRRGPLLLLLALFVLAVVALGRVRGFFALLGLGASIAVLLVFMIPALLEGSSPVLVAIVSSTAIAYLALFLAHGFRSMTLVALLGTLIALALTIGLASVFTALTELTGYVSDEAFLVQVGRTGFDIQGLVLAGMVIGALGALDDMTVTQAAAVAELRAADPTMPRRELTRAGLRIGRDHVASTVNTLALAYAGAALPLLIIFVLAQQSLGTVANSEIVATEIVRTLVGSIGLVAAVPVTTWLAARVVGPPVPGAISSPAAGPSPPPVPEGPDGPDRDDADRPRPAAADDDLEARFWG